MFVFLLTVAAFSACDKGNLEDYYFDYEGQKKIDEEVIRRYFRANNVDTTKVERTASGLYYLKTKEGTGPKATLGKIVEVKYVGRFAYDNKKFDSSYDRGEVLTVQIGARQVIPGWDEGLQLMKEGEDATLFIPSHLAYGPQGRYPVPPSAVLVFEVEMVKVH